MKMDKETLAKNRFWIGLIAFAPLWLLILIVALVSSGDKATANAKQVDDAKKKVAGINNPKNERFTTLVAEKQKDLEEQKKKVWAEAWKGQEHLMKWPDGIDGKAQLEAAAYFGDDLSDAQRNQFRDVKSYYAQLPPGDEKHEGMKNWLYPVEADWGKLIHRADFEKSGKDPTNEEVWLAQEDIWVQQELLSVVKSALDSASRFENVAHFKRVEIPKAELDKLNAAPAAPAAGTAPPKPAGPAEAPPAEEPANKKQPTVVRQRFHTPHWRLDLVLEQNAKKELTVTPQTALSSIDATLPVPGIEVRLWQNSAKPPQPQLLHFEGGKPGASVALAKAVPLPGFAANLDDLPLDVNVAADKSGPPLPAGTRREVFRNPNWELELLIVKKEGVQPVLSGESKLTNINSTRRTLSLGSAMFRVYQPNRLVTDIFMPGEWLAWTKTATILGPGQKPLPFSYDEGVPLEVAQLFNPYTSPVKQINAFQIPGSPECVSFNSHRTANLMLKPAAQFPVEAPKEAPAGGGAGGGMAGLAGMGGARGGLAGMGGAMGGQPGAPPGGLPGAAGAADSSKTPNGIVRNRYISVTEQVRHMPVALSLIVEQANMQDVLTAVTNSRLRIQITQVQWTRKEDFKPGGMAAGGGAGGGLPAGGMGAGGMGGGMFPGGMLGGGSGSGTSPYGPGMRPGGRGGMPPPAPGIGGGGFLGGLGGGNNPVPAAGEPSDPNLVEVAVYGIAALYERYPPKPPAKPEGTAAGPGQPAVPPSNPVPPGVK